MQWLENTIYNNTLTEWLIALGVASLVMFGLKAASTILIRRMEVLSARTETDLDDLITELVKKTKFLFILLVGLWTGSHTLDLPESIDGALGTVLVVGFLLQGGFWGNGIVSYLIERYRKQQIETDPGVATALGALGFIGRLGVWVTVVLAALAEFGVPITTFVASLGIGGVAIALALQNVLSDLFASLSIVFDKPFVVGDFVVVDEYQGTVEHVGLKTTRLRSLSGEQLVFSNSDLLSSRVRNYKRMDERRIAFALGVTYGTPAEKLERIPGIVRQAVESRANARFDRCHFKSYGDFALNFETVYYMTVPDYAAYMDTQQDINLELYRQFEEEGVEFAFPTQTLHLAREA